MPFWQPSIFQQHNAFSIYLSCDYVPTSYGIVCDYFASHHLMCCTNGMQYFRSLYVKPAETCYQHQIPTQMWLKYMEVSLFHIWTQYALVMKNMHRYTCTHRYTCMHRYICIYAYMCAYWKYSNTRSDYIYIFVANETCLKRKRKRIWGYICPRSGWCSHTKHDQCMWSFQSDVKQRQQD